MPRVRAKERPQFPDHDCKTPEEQAAYLSGMYMGAELTVTLAGANGAPPNVIAVLDRVFLAIDEMASHLTTEQAGGEQGDIPKLPDIPTNPNRTA